jgi:hypothetical protein
LDETGGANKLIALKDTEWYLLQQSSSRRTATLLYQGFLHSTGLKSRGEIVVFFRAVKAPEVVRHFLKNNF